jgi:hypothetical protein
MTQRTLEERVADLERRVADLSAEVVPERRGMTGPELVAYMQAHGEELGPIFDQALKLREKDREKARRRFAREDARNAAQKQAPAARRRAKR